jgi:hypothetical protein
MHDLQKKNLCMVFSFFGLCIVSADIHSYPNLINIHFY